MQKGTGKEQGIPWHVLDVSTLAQPIPIRVPLALCSPATGQPSRRVGTGQTEERCRAGSAS